MRWWKNLKKWQKGGLIGCAVGLFFIIVTISPLIITTYNYPEWLEWPAFLNFWIFIPMVAAAGPSDTIAFLAASASLVVFYGGFGAIMGRIQQMADPSWKVALTVLLALIILFIWFADVVIGMALVRALS